MFSLIAAPTPLVAAPPGGALGGRQQSIASCKFVLLAAGVATQTVAPPDVAITTER